MTANRWREVKDLFDLIQSVPLDERHRWLSGVTAQDPDLRKQVVALLEADEASEFFLAESPVTDVRAAFEMRMGAVPGHIGPYRVHRELGRGGMGVVYLAARDDDSYQKLVAIKLVRAGFDTELLRRFQHERQILADLDHPHIGGLLDGGTTEQGYPYLIMEFVDGVPITSYCDHHRLQVPDRLRLFQKVCAAVHHAHQNLVLHRDLKPANILITQDGEPKLLDFGIAKLLAPERAGELNFTCGIHPMTPDYASPEQLRNGQLTTASDIYALGVILYELVCGARPYAVMSGGSRSDLERTIIDSRPERPSVHACRNGAGVAESRRTTPDKLRRMLDGDIDKIVLMALRKEPERRYISALALADDLRRHLEFFPVVARTDTIGYRASRFLRRNRRIVSLAGAASLALCIVASVAVWRDRRAKAERVAIEVRSNEAREFGMSLLDDAYRNGKKKGAADHQRRKKTNTEYPLGLPGEPENDQDMQANVAWAYGYRGPPRPGGRGLGADVSDYRKAIRILEPLAVADPSDARVGRLLALTYERAAYSEANISVTASLESHRLEVAASERLVQLRPDPPVHVYSATALRAMAERLGHPDYANIGDTAAARREMERAVKVAEQWVPRLAHSHEGTWYLGYCYSILAGTVWAEGDIDAALALQQRALAAFKGLPNHLPNWKELQSEEGMIHVRLGHLYHEAGRLTEALNSLQHGIGMLEPMFREDPNNPNLRRHLTIASNYLGDVLLDSEPGRALRWYSQAEQWSVDWLARRPSALEVRERLGESRSGMARAMAALGDRKDADEKSRQGVEIAESLTKLDPRNAHYAFSLTLAYLHRGAVMEGAGTAAAAGEYLKGLAVIEPLAEADPSSWLKRRALAELRDRLKRQLSLAEKRRAQGL